ncbi:hypothetical protein MSAN_01437900 [Mycena sanguinolenta]|uniref:DUF7719 domain-containing protein n=1 Tax=Mycena sanguinolenta TaxID=230812 RepID=A0A8H6YB83_9AGAR|nr:hypothetical protein MSAN_01437900 [Mycena sanguinolenta]
MRSRSSKATQSPKAPLVEISEEEQWRIINQSGVLKSDALRAVNSPDDAEEPSLGEEIFSALLLIIPCVSLLLLMQILIYNQYGQEVNLKTIADRMVEGVPILSIFIFYTTRHKRNPRVQLLLLLIGSAAGCRMLFLLKRAGYLANIRQCPPLVTLWVYVVIQLDLGLAVLNLAVVGAFCWWKKLDLFH